MRFLNVLIFSLLSFATLVCDGANAQTEFDFWKDVQAFDDLENSSEANTSDSDFSTDLSQPDLDVKQPDEIPDNKVPLPPQEETRKLEESELTKKNIIKKPNKTVAPVVLKKDGAQIKDQKSEIPPSDKYISKTLSKVLKKNEDLESNFSVNGNEVRRRYDNKAALPKLLQKKRFDKNNKHIPKVVYQKQYSELLFAAIKMDDIGAINALIKNGADINAKFVESGYTALMYAIQLGKPRVIRYLITKGANINTQGDDGRTPLHLAANMNNLEVFMMLIENNANPFKYDKNGKAAIDYAPSGYRNQYEAIVARNSNIDDKDLFHFVELGSIRGVITMLDNGAEINIRNAYGDTPLMIAVRKNNIDLVNVLLSRDASTLPVNRNGQHALSIAQTSGFIDIAKIIETVNIRKELELGKVTNNKKLKRAIISTEPKRYTGPETELLYDNSVQPEQNQDIESEHGHIINQEDYRNNEEDKSVVVDGQTEEDGDRQSNREVVIKKKNSTIKNLRDSLANEEDKSKEEDPRDGGEKGILSGLIDYFSAKSKNETEIKPNELDIIQKQLGDLKSPPEEEPSKLNSVERGNKTSKELKAPEIKKEATNLPKGIVKKTVKN